MSTPSTPAFDRLMTFLCLWFVGGIYLDGWAHNHLDSSLETFFTPWHGVMYSGFAVVALTLFVRALMGRRTAGTLRPSLRWLDPRDWKDTVPDGYFPSLLGAAVFAAGGAFDLLWHSTFGIEKDIEALLSPAHLFLAVGAFLIASGPLRAAWRKTEPLRGLVASLPMLLSAAFTVSIVSFMTMFAHPVRHFAAGLRPANAVLADIGQGRAVAGFIMQLTLLTGLALLLRRRWGKELPFGAFTIVFLVNLAGMANMTDGYEYRLLPAALAAGLLADYAKSRNVRFFALAVPATYALFVFCSLFGAANVWWSVHMWTGTVAMAGFAGLLASYLAYPPRQPQA